MVKRLKTNINTPEEYNRMFGNRRFGIDRKEPLRAKAMLAKFTGGKFLDIGCGVATHCELALKIEGAEVYGMDFADKLIESLKTQYPTVNYAVEDIRKMTYLNETFDYISMGEVIEHLEDPAETLKEVVRILKTGGILAISTPHGTSGIRTAPHHHIWIFEVGELKGFLEPFGEVELNVLEENKHHYIIAYLTKK